MGKLSPMMEQYFEVKNRYKHCLVFFRLGDFYELFYDDAYIASKALDLTLTGRDCHQAEKAPMCGVPYHAAEGYIAKLIEKGYKVAICEQIEDPKLTKTIVKRDVVRVITPGTIIDANQLDEGKNNYIMCIYENKNGYGLSFADVTTGEFLTTYLKKDPGDEDKKITDEIAKYLPAEIIVNDGFKNSRLIEKIFNIKPAIYSEWAFNKDTAYKKLVSHFKTQNLNGFGLEDMDLSISSSGALLEYLFETQKNSLSHISTLKSYSKENFMVLDVSSRRNLELTGTIREKAKKGSLLWVLDNTKTAMGARQLRKWIEQPLIMPNEIIRRLDAVEEFKDDLLFREEIKELLNPIYDIERIMGKIIYETAGGRDLVSLKKSFAYLPSMKQLMQNCQSKLLIEMYNAFDPLSDIYELIERSIKDEPPFGIREGDIIKDNYNEELDTYREAKNKGTTWLLELETKEKEETGIKNLKIKFSKVFGYCFEVTNSYKGLVPDRFIRRQTLSNCERYTTEELKKIETAILGAEEKINQLEYDLFSQIRKEISSHIERIQLTASIISTIDVLQSLAAVADKNNYCKPIIDNNGIIEIKEGRHPVVEQMISNAFIPNDTYLDLHDDRLAIITGPNMAGKSTYMRQTALIVLMAQIGSYIPADSAAIGVVDRIFTRVGASDDLATGQSTFMVEMSEVANILNNSTKNSLLILDEIGRGTSTFDGLSIAWSVLEYIADKNRLGAKTLFATHYHELTELEGKVDGVKNYCITVEEQGDDIIFLRKIALGGADNSYGIHVAKLAGLPPEILSRSNEILNALSSADITKRQTDTIHQSVQYTEKKPFDELKYRIIINELASIDIDTMTPREALRALYELQSKSKGDENG